MKSLRFNMFGVAFFLIPSAIYGLICLFFYFKQADFIFIGAPVDREYETLWQTNSKRLKTGNIELEYWHLNNTNKETGWLLYFGGNAENVVYNLPLFEKLNISNIVAMNYRGYGNSGGQASENALFSDALALYDNLKQNHRSSFNNVIVMGRSLGSGIASYLSQQRKTSGSILVTPYDSIENIAKSIFPWLPIGYLLKHKFESAKYAKNVDTPLLMLVADKDNVIPNRFSKNLFSHWAGKKVQHVIDADHNSIADKPEYYLRINRFLLELRIEY